MLPISCYKTSKIAEAFVEICRCILIDKMFYKCYTDFIKSFNTSVFIISFIKLVLFNRRFCRIFHNLCFKRSVMHIEGVLSDSISRIICIVK